jgi:hypothetical protein
MKFFKIPLLVWVSVGGVVALDVVGQVINHIKVNKVKSKRKILK